MKSFEGIFKDSCCFRISESQRMLEKALTILPEEVLWKRPNEQSNSVGNQLLHMKGNLTQYVLSALGDTSDHRDRDREFTTRDGIDLQTLWNDLNKTLEVAKQCIQNCPERRLLQSHNVQGFSLSGVDVAVHAVEHLSYHTGQIAFWVKQLTAKPLGFYDGMNLNAKND